jgi:hypothetical protein
MRDINGMSQEDIIELITKMEEVHKGLSHKEKVEHYCEHWHEQLTPVVVRLLDEHAEGRHLSRAMLLHAAAGFFKGLADAEQTLGPAPDLDADQRDFMSDLYGRLGVMTFDCGFEAGKDFMVYTRHRKHSRAPDLE